MPKTIQVGVRHVLYADGIVVAVIGKKYVFPLTSFPPLVGIVTYLLPNIKEKN